MIKENNHDIKIVEGLISLVSIGDFIDVIDTDDERWDYSAGVVNISNSDFIIMSNGEFDYMFIPKDKIYLKDNNLAINIEDIRIL